MRPGRDIGSRRDREDLVDRLLLLVDLLDCGESRMVEQQCVDLFEIIAASDRDLDCLSRLDPGGEYGVKPGLRKLGKSERWQKCH